MTDSTRTASAAVYDFRAARRRAALEQITSRLRGKSADLLSYEEVRRKLRALETSNQTLVDIPLDAIVGSVGRYRDFTRGFLPRSEASLERWTRVKGAAEGQLGMPPIEAYKVGEAYFVKDGNHRVSVARQQGSRTIQAYVTEVKTAVPLSPDDQPDDLILKAEYAAFLERTDLKGRRPRADLTLTVPGSYQRVEEQIRVHRYAMNAERPQQISFEQAAVHWFDHVYTPVVEVIRRSGVLRDFPGRTEADLYLWVSEHKAALERSLGLPLQTDSALADLAERFSPAPGRRAARLGARLLDAVIPDELETGPPPGAWRRQKAHERREEVLFEAITVALGAEVPGQIALEQALVIARREGARLLGVHVARGEGASSEEQTEALRDHFLERCAREGVQAAFQLEHGRVARRLCESARWSDLIVANLAHPPGSQPLQRLASGIRTLIRRCPRPILTAPAVHTPLERPLLAFDGSPKAQEALYIAAYIGQRWGVPLEVVAVLRPLPAGQAALDRARAYLDDHQVNAHFTQVEGEAASALIAVSSDRGCDLILMGGYGAAPMREVVLGSTVDELLRRSGVPLLICR